jgi:hypothetical protein
MYAQYMKQYGRALKILQKSYEDKPTQEMEVNMIKVRIPYLRSTHAVFMENRCKLAIRH